MVDLKNHAVWEGLGLPQGLFDIALQSSDHSGRRITGALRRRVKAGPCEIRIVPENGMLAGDQVNIGFEGYGPAYARTFTAGAGFTTGDKFFSFRCVMRGIITLNFTPDGARGALESNLVLVVPDVG